MARPWYWNMQRLTSLQEILRKLSEPTSDPNVNLIPTPKALAKIVRPIYNTEIDPEADESLVSLGLTLLGSFGVLEPGRPGVKPVGYKRRFYPKVTLNDGMILIYRMGKK